MNQIKDHLKKYGYYLNYSFDDNECSNALLRLLGKSEYKMFWKLVDEASINKNIDTEQFIRNYFVKNPKAIKILTSGQIAISVSILESIIKNILEDIEYIDIRRVLELGGSDGWAADFLLQNISKIQKIDIVDKNYENKKLNTKIEIFKNNYADFESAEKYDLIFSILGAPALMLDEMINCLNKNVLNNTIIYIALRLQPYEYTEFQKRMNLNNFISYKNGIDRIFTNLDLGGQTIPLFKFKHIHQ